MTPQIERTILFNKKKRGGKCPRIRSGISKNQMFWLAGLLEGEGSFMSGPPSSPNKSRISCQMTDEDVIAKVAGLFGVRPCAVRKVAKAHYKPTYTAAISGINARELMQQLRPLMSKRRQGQIDRAIAAYDPALEFASRLKRRAIEESETAEIKERYEKGESLRKIAKKYGVHHETIRSRIHGGMPYSYRKDSKFVFEN